MTERTKDGERGDAPVNAAGQPAGGTSPKAPPSGACGADLALLYALEDSEAAGREEGLRIAKPQFGNDDGTAGVVNLLNLNQSVVYSLLIRKRYPG